MMTVQITCPHCKSSIEIYPDTQASIALCEVCQHEVPVHFNSTHLNSELTDCAVCGRQDFFIQKDFNRALGVSLFVLAAILSIWTYGVSLIVLYLCDLFLFRKLRYVAVCYKCNTIYRGAQNTLQLPEFNHEMHDRIVYSDHNFHGKPLDH
jgi:hypothetical protein